MKTLYISLSLLIFWNPVYGREGIVAFKNCSGALVSLETQSPDAKALIMTNGHCVKKFLGLGYLGPQEVLTNKNSRKKIKIFNRHGKSIKLKTAKLLYATLHVTDLAIYQLNLTYRQLETKHDIRPLRISSAIQTDGEVTILSGYSRNSYNCTIQGLAPVLVEAGHIFYNSIRLGSDCPTIPGTSGSPIISKLTGEVVGISNSTNENGKKCTTNNPCEIRGKESWSMRGMRYGQQTHLLYDCLSQRGDFDLGRQSCQLPRP